MRPAWCDCWCRVRQAVSWNDNDFRRLHRSCSLRRVRSSLERCIHVLLSRAHRNSWLQPWNAWRFGWLVQLRSKERDLDLIRYSTSIWGWKDAPIPHRASILRIPCKACSRPSWPLVGIYTSSSDWTCDVRLQNDTWNCHPSEEHHLLFRQMQLCSVQDTLLQFDQESTRRYVKPYR